MTGPTGPTGTTPTIPSVQNAFFGNGEGQSNIDVIFNPANQLINGTDITFTAPSTINLNPGTYFIIWRFIGSNLEAGANVDYRIFINGAFPPQAIPTGASATGGLPFDPVNVGNIILNIAVPSTFQLRSATGVAISIDDVQLSVIKLA